MPEYRVDMGCVSPKGYESHVGGLISATENPFEVLAWLEAQAAQHGYTVKGRDVQETPAAPPPLAHRTTELCIVFARQHSDLPDSVAENSTRDMQKIPRLLVHSFTRFSFLASAHVFLQFLKFIHFSFRLLKKAILSCQIHPHVLQSLPDCARPRSPKMA